MIYAHAMSDAKREALAKVGEGLFSDVLNLGDAETKEKVLVQSKERVKVGRGARI